MAETPLLEMRQITKRFASVEVLTRVGLELNRGEILALVGENGAGKSTLMKILCGSIPFGSFDGEILLEGARREFPAPKAAHEAGIRMIHQELSLHWDLSIAENIFLGNLPRRRFGLINWEKAFRESRTLLRRVGLEESPRETLRSLNKGKQQLVAIAKALAHDPRILILDEPTAALTEREADGLLELLRTLKRQGISSIHISHRLKEVFAIADRIMVLRDGRVISSCSRKAADPERIVEDMIGRKIGNMYPKLSTPRGEEVLRVEHFTVPHPQTRRKNILTDISFSLKKGEILGLAGLVGSGRSELVNAVFGSGEHDGTGRVHLEGREIRIRGPRDSIRAGIGLVTEDRKTSGFVPTMDLKENMTLASLGKISGYGLIHSDRERGEALRYARQFKIKAAGLDASILSLSGGNQQKIVLSKWLMSDLKVLILDEPTRGVDVGAKADIYLLMTELARQGLGIVMISSELPELLAMCDRFVVLSDGRIADEFERKEASAVRLMRAAVGA